MEFRNVSRDGWVGFIWRYFFQPPPRFILGGERVSLPRKCFSLMMMMPKPKRQHEGGWGWSRRLICPTNNTSLFRRCDPQTSMNADECMVLLGWRSVGVNPGT